jgi:hypothetical protein
MRRRHWSGACRLSAATGSDLSGKLWKPQNTRARTAGSCEDRDEGV